MKFANSGSASRLAALATTHAIYSGVLWFVVVARANASGLARLVAAICWLGGLATFAIRAVAPRRGWNALLEFALAATLRTATPACCALACVLCFDREEARAVVWRILIAYFATAPVALFLAFPRDLRGNGSDAAE